MEALKRTRRLQNLPPNLLSVLALCYLYADKHGYGRWPDLKLRPFDVTSDDVRRFLQELKRLGFIEHVADFSRTSPSLPTFKLPRAPRRPGFVWRLVYR